MPDTLIIWIAVCTLLVLIMQAGFTCFEAGIVRRKNSTNVALKNAADIGLCVLLFMLIGYPLMFGSAQSPLPGLIGWGISPLMSDDPLAMMKALFQAMFAGTTITIISGALSERTSFRGYLVIALFMSVMIYPITGHWAWSENGWLNKMGFYDYAGGIVVHAVGGAIALAAVLHVGPRIGRFENKSGIEPSNLSFATLGMFLLFFGWFGFNAGAATSLGDELPLIMVNTALGATAGLFVIMMMVIVGKLRPKPEIILTAPLGGLVAITPGCAAVGPLGAVIIGLVGAACAVFGMRYLEKRKIDDPVGAIPVHLFAGVVGTILIPIFALQSQIPDVVSDRYHWFVVQFFSTAVITLYAFVMSYVFIALTKKKVAYRVLEKDEMIGLNISEHDANTAMFDLIQQMSAQGEKGEFSRPIVAEPQTDASYIAYFYNQVREKFLNETNRSQALLEEANHLAYHDSLTGLHNRRAFTEAARRKISDFKRYGSHCAIIIMDVDHFKKINDEYGHDVGDEVLKELAIRLKKTARETDLVSRFGGEEFAILVSLENDTEIDVPAERFRLSLSSEAFETSAGLLSVTASFGVAVICEHMDLNEALKIGDKALYTAKNQGRNRVSVGTAPSHQKNSA